METSFLSTRWPHQVRGVNQVTDLIDSGAKSVCITSPTGGGKSLLMCDLIDWARQKGWPVALYTHRKLLTAQLDEVLNRMGLDHGIRAAEYRPEFYKPVQICSLQTENSRNWHRHPAKLVLLDEAHLQKSGMALGIIQEHRDQDDAVVVGITATPVDIGHIYDHLVVAGTNSELRECGAHVPCKHYAPDEPDSRLLKRTKTGEYTEGSIRKAIMTPTIMGRVYDNWKRYNPEARPTILFAPGVGESVWFAEQFWQKGVTVAHIDGEDVWINGEFYKSTKDVRDQALAASECGDVKVLCNRFVLREAIDCLDEHTEVLTETGWKGIDSHWLPGELVYSLNKNSNKAELVPSEYVMSRMSRIDEKFVTIKGLHADVRTTEGHRFHTKYKDPVNGRYHKNWLVNTAIDVRDDVNTRNSDVAFPISARGDFPGSGLSTDEIKLIAWYLTDGSIEAQRLIIYQSSVKSKYVNEIRDLLTRLGAPYREHKKKTGKYGFKRKDGRTFDTHVFSVKKAWWWRLREYLKKDGTSLYKSFTRREFRILFREMCKGDGTFPRSGNPYLGTARRPICDLITGMAVVRGYACCATETKMKSGLPFWTIQIRDKKFIGIRFQDERASKIGASVPDRPERVWCVTNRNDTLITRRNGKIMILGNCPWLYCGIAATTFGLVSYLQSGGRLLRSHPSLDHVVWIDQGGNWWRHGSLNEDREWEMSLTAGSYERLRADRIREDKDPEPITCPQCHAIRLSGAVCPQCGFKTSKRSRMVIQKDGSLKEMTGKIFRPRMTRMLSDTQRKWEKVFWRARKSGMTFSQAEGLFFIENRYYPPRDLEKMPRREVSWYLPVKDVPWHELRRE